MSKLLLMVTKRQVNDLSKAKLHCLTPFETNTQFLTLNENYNLR